jgi:hypothetical protein
MFFESLQRSIQDSNFHQHEINGLDREQARKAPENREFRAIRSRSKLAVLRESREFLDFFESSK